jgi:hypothetical protein
MLVAYREIRVWYFPDCKRFLASTRDMQEYEMVEAGVLGTETEENRRHDTVIEQNRYHCDAQEAG